MVQINFAQKQVNAKIVYYGPGMSGKTTNLEIIHQRAPKANRGELTSISTDGDRTLFFDFMPLDLGTVAGMRTCFQIYTVPGQVYYNSTRKLVLQGVDGVIFVADSSASMMEENLESLRNLDQNLAEYGRSLEDVALVIQYNKRDLPDALPIEELDAQLNPGAVPAFEGVAHTGQGVFPTLKALAARVIENIHNQQRAALSPGGSSGSRRPTREAAPQAGAPEAPAAPLPARAETAAPVPAAMASQAPPQRQEQPAQPAAGGLRMAGPRQAPAPRASAPAAPTAAPQQQQAAPPSRTRRPAPPEAQSAPQARPAARPAGKPAGANQPGRSGGGGRPAGNGRGNAPAQGRAPKPNKAGRGGQGQAPAPQGRRPAQQAPQSGRRTPRPTPAPQKSNRSSVLTLVIVIASIGIGAVLGSLVLGAL